jgi:hypothetical protein
MSQIASLVNYFGLPQCRCSVCNCLLVGGSVEETIVPRCPSHFTRGEEIAGKVIIPMPKDEETS